MSKIFRIILSVLILGIAGLWIYLLYKEYILLPTGSEYSQFVLFEIKTVLFALFAVASLTLILYFNMFSSRQQVKTDKTPESPQLDQFSVTGNDTANIDVMANLESIRHLLSSRLNVIDHIKKYDDMDARSTGCDSEGEETLMKILAGQIQLLGTANFPDLLNSLVETASQTTGAKRVSLFLHNPEKKNLKMVRGIGFETTDPIEINPEEGFAGYAFNSGKRIFVTNVETHPQLGRKNKPQYRSKSFIIFPIRLFLQDNCIGVLNLTEKEGENGIFNMVDLEKINILVNNFRLKMENMILLREFNKSNPGETPTP